MGPAAVQLGTRSTSSAAAAILGALPPQQRTGALLAGTLAGASPAAAAALAAAGVPGLLVGKLKVAEPGVAGAAAWALERMCWREQGLPEALVAAGALPALIAAYGRLARCANTSGGSDRSSSSSSASPTPAAAGAADAAAAAKAAAKALIRCCGDAAALEALVQLPTPPVLMRHVVERLSSLLQLGPRHPPCAAGWPPEGGAAGSDVTGAARRAFVAAGGLARLQEVAAAIDTGRLALGVGGARGTKLAARLRTACGAINALFPAEVVAYYAAAASAAGGDALQVPQACR